uniref:Uncharacterized protein n=1 Tax=Globisporangium ultimum (strain ATCC 200006 / CBS 805.95 / DAOM BR144) TaxID=431595 RepID=K3WMG8_GLOUD
MMQFSDKCKAWAKDKGVMPILLDCFKIVDQRKLYQVADKLLHLCVLLPEEDESKTARIDPRVLGIIHEDRSAVDTINASAGASSIAAKRAPFVGLDVLLSLLETSSTAEDKVVLFRLIRWLASLVDSPENAIGLGESGVSILLRIVIETFQEHCLLIGYLAKCIRAGTSQSAAACEVRKL